MVEEFFVEKSGLNIGFGIFGIEMSSNLFAMVELLLLSGSPKLFLFGLPGQFMSMKGSLIGTLEL